MPRPSDGPRLQKLKPPRYAQALWFAVWYERGQQCKRSAGTADRGIADRWFYEVFLPEWTARRRRRGSEGPREPGEVTVAEALDLYGAEHAPTTADPERIGYAIKALLGWWGARSVAEVTEPNCRRYARERGVKPGTSRRELGTLAAALVHATKAFSPDGEEERRPILSSAPDVWLPEAGPAKDRWLTRSEAARLLRAARASDQARLHLPLFILIGLYTGARKEAILALQWQPNSAGGWVDLEQGRIDFNAAGRRQTNKRRSLIPIPPRLRRFLLAARQRSSVYVLETTAPLPARPYRPAPQRGKPRPIGSIKKSFAAAAVRAGLAVESGRVDAAGAPIMKAEVSPHVLRHTCCTWMMHAGVEIWEAAGYVGMDPKVFTRVYASHHPNFMAGAANAFNRRRG